MVRWQSMKKNRIKYVRWITNGSFSIETPHIKKTELSLSWVTQYKYIVTWKRKCCSGLLHVQSCSLALRLFVVFLGDNSFRSSLIQGFAQTNNFFACACLNTVHVASSMNRAFYVTCSSAFVLLITLYFVAFCECSSHNVRFARSNTRKCTILMPILVWACSIYCIRNKDETAPGACNKLSRHSW